VRWQNLGFSRELSFVAPPAVGRGSTVRFLAVADLGHTQTDGSAEINHDQAHDLLNYTPVDTLQHVRPHRSFMHSASRLLVVQPW